MTDTASGRNDSIEARFLIPSIIVIVAAILIMYLPVIHHEFVYDDFIVVTENPDIRDFSVEGIKHLFVGRDYQNYLPLRMVLYSAVYHFAGPDNPAPFHIMNIILHILNSILVLFLTASIIRSAYPDMKRDAVSMAAFTAAIIFAVHPLHIESVTWITGMKELLSSFFCISAMMAFVRYRTRGLALGYPIIIILFTAALLSKATALFLPLVFILYDAIFPKREGKLPVSHLIAEHVFILLIAGCCAYLNFALAADKQMIVAAEGGSRVSHMATILGILPFYMKMSIWPWPLSLLYDIPIAKGFFQADILLSAAVMICVAAAFFRFLRTSTAAAFAIAFFILAFGPTLNIVPFGILAADRYAYLPLFGFCLLAGVGASVLYSRGGIQRYLLYVLILVCAGLSFRAADIRNDDWKDPIALWNSTVKTAPNSAKAQMSLGIAYLDKEMFDQAKEHLEKSKELDPYYPKSYIGLSLYYRKKNQPTHAFNVLKEGMKYNPEEIELHYNLGIVYFEQGAYKTTARIMAIVLSEYEGYKQARNYFNMSMQELSEVMTPEEMEFFMRTISNPRAVKDFMESDGKNP